MSNERRGLKQPVRYLTEATLHDMISRYGAVKGDRGRDGEDGQRGPEGPRGLKGERGEKGDKGEQGRKGIEGLRGPEGREGCRGEKGDIGCQGKQGEKGDRGECGEKGESGSSSEGEPGLTGPAGEKGDTGAQGIPGQKGEQGEQGEKGDQGEMGLPGTAGIQGDTGETGPAGEKGDKGDKGEKGDTGEQGLKGDKGDDGAVGEKGEKGDAGNQGEVGVAGLNGGIPGCDSPDNTTVSLTVDLQDGNGPQVYCTISKDGSSTDTNFYLVSATPGTVVSPNQLDASLPITFTMNNGATVELFLTGEQLADVLGAYTNQGTGGLTAAQVQQLIDNSISNINTGGLTAAQAQDLISQSLNDYIQCEVTQDPNAVCFDRAVMTVNGESKALQLYETPELCDYYCVTVDAGDEVVVELEAPVGYVVHWGENDQSEAGTGQAGSAISYTYLTAGTYKLRVCLDEYCDSEGNEYDPSYYSISGYRAIDGTCG